ncbi:MAG: hypothetical protein MJ237_01825 [bacterium]|nr:hypothetical protein [bacterium]
MCKFLKSFIKHFNQFQCSRELINDFSIVRVSLTGGEIFARPDIMDIIRKQNVCCSEDAEKVKK